MGRQIFCVHFRLVYVHFDDGLHAAAGNAIAMVQSQIVCSTPERAGFIAHPSKSVWKLTQCLTWLEF